MTSSRCTRRDVLRSGLLGAGSLWLAPGLLASAPRRASFRSGRVLVVLQLSGGNDGLNTLVPFDHDVYRKARPTLALKPDRCLKVADGLGFHPALKNLRALLESGELAVVQGVGYPHPNRSHFKSMDIWQSADATAKAKRAGWLARLCAQCNTGAGGEIDADAAAEWSVNVAARTPLALEGEACQPISFTDPARFRFRGSEAEQEVFTRMTEAERAELGEREILDLLGRTAANARTSSEAVRKAVSDYRTDVEYPGGRLGPALKTVAALLQSDLQTQVFYVYQGGYDTHAGQAARHQRLLQELDGALGAFEADLRRTGDADRVSLMAFSEFGRRVKENGSGGTDHGAAGHMLLLGRHVRGGLHGAHPDLDSLQRGDPVFTTDFRSVYQAVIEDWMGVDSAAVLGARFPRLELFPV